MPSAHKTVSLFLTLGLVASCNMVKFTVDTTADALAVAAPSLNMESDVQLAREAAPAQLKTVEGFLLASPNNTKLLEVLAQGYCEYTFGFLEPEFERLTAKGKYERADALAKRATRLYLRCMNYGLRLLGGTWEKSLYGDTAGFEKQVKGAGGDQVTGMFYTALGLASAINLNRDDIEMIAYLPKVTLLFERVLTLNEKFYNGGAHMALGMLHTAQGAALGGNPQKGKAHFEKAIAITQGKFLVTRVLLAKAYGVITHDVEFFHKTLADVLTTSPAIWPEQRLANELAHELARFYLSQEKEWF